MLYLKMQRASSGRPIWGSRASEHFTSLSFICAALVRCDCDLARISHLHRSFHPAFHFLPNPSRATTVFRRDKSHALRSRQHVRSVASRLRRPPKWQYATWARAAATTTWSSRPAVTKSKSDCKFISLVHSLRSCSFSRAPRDVTRPRRCHMKATLKTRNPQKHENIALRLAT